MAIHVPTEDGRWVDETYARLAEIISDYDPYLELRWIPPESRQSLEDKTKCYAIFDTRTNYLVMTASELDTPPQVLAKLFDIDNKNGDVLKRLENHNAAVKAFELKEHMERMGEANEFAKWVWKNEKNVWKHNGIKYDDEMRRLT